MYIDRCFQRGCCTASLWVAEDLEYLGYVSYFLGKKDGNGLLTVDCKANEENHAGLQRKYVQ